MGLEPGLLATTLCGVLAQRLVRSVCPDCCMEAAQPPPESTGDAVQAAVELQAAVDEKIWLALQIYRFWRASPCIRARGFAILLENSGKGRRGSGSRR